jgi:hypothetical protein
MRADTIYRYKQDIRPDIRRQWWRQWSRPSRARQDGPVDSDSNITNRRIYISSAHISDITLHTL